MTRTRQSILGIEDIQTLGQTNSKEKKARKHSLSMDCISMSYVSGSGNQTLMQFEAMSKDFPNRY
jgi:hypothetical protein